MLSAGSDRKPPVGFGARLPGKRTKAYRLLQAVRTLAVALRKQPFAVVRQLRLRADGRPSGLSFSTSVSVLKRTVDGGRYEGVMLGKVMHNMMHVVGFA